MLLIGTTAPRQPTGEVTSRIFITRSASGPIRQASHREQRNRAWQSAQSLQATTFLEVLEDLERVLATRREFLLGPWLEAAKVR